MHLKCFCLIVILVSAFGVHGQQAENREYQEFHKERRETLPIYLDYFHDSICQLKKEIITQNHEILRLELENKKLWQEQENYWDKKIQIDSLYYENVLEIFSRDSAPKPVVIYPESEYLSLYIADTIKDSVERYRLKELKVRLFTERPKGNCIEVKFPKPFSTDPYFKNNPIVDIQPKTSEDDNPYIYCYDYSITELGKSGAKLMEMDSLFHYIEYGFVGGRFGSNYSNGERISSSTKPIICIKVIKAKNWLRFLCNWLSYQFHQAYVWAALIFSVIAVIVSNYHLVIDFVGIIKGWRRKKE